VNKNYDLANAMLAKLRRVPGLTDVRVQQPFDYPTLDIAVDRTKASQGGFTERDVTTSVLNTLSGSFQVAPMFFLNWQNGVNYDLVAQTPQYKMDAIEDLQNIPINRSTAGVNAATQEILADIAALKRNHEMAVVNHDNIRRVVDIYGAVQGRDLGAVGNDVEKIIDASLKCPATFPMSLGLMAAAFTRTSASPSPGSGIATSSNRSTDGGPNAVKRSAFITPPVIPDAG
jgi:Cu/Ag efflux pump CusA